MSHFRRGTICQVTMLTTIDEAITDSEAFEYRITYVTPYTLVGHLLDLLIIDQGQQAAGSTMTEWAREDVFIMGEFYGVKSVDLFRAIFALGAKPHRRLTTTSYPPGVLCNVAAKLDYERTEVPLMEFMQQRWSIIARIYDHMKATAPVRLPGATPAENREARRRGMLKKQ